VARAVEGGVIGFSRSLAMEVREYGINVNCVAPGLTVTAPVKRDEQPEDLAGPVFFLASPEGNFTSGQMLVVDGGKIKH
jgi:NAD(P)-dependent dehydrogenase (short-subunit alcohol dehydrogenase family)